MLDLGIGVYAIGLLICWRIFAGHIAWDVTNRNPPSWADWSFGAFFGFIGALFWLPVLAIMGIRRWVLPAIEELPLMSDTERKGRAKLRAEELEKANKEAEKAALEAGVGQHDDIQEQLDAIAGSIGEVVFEDAMRQWREAVAHEQTAELALAKACGFDTIAALRAYRNHEACVNGTKL